MNKPKTEIEQMSKPEVNRVNQKTNYVKIALHPEQLKFGKRSEDQARIFAELKSNIKKDAESFDVEVVGIENTKAQNRALFAIQTLLDEKNYKGNLPSKKFKSYAFKKKFELPIIKFTPAQYLKAYGVKKYKSARGKSEFCCNEREIAKQALLDLASKRFLLIYERKYYVEVNKRRMEERFDIIRTVSPLIKIIEGYKALKRQEREAVKSGKDTSKTESKKFIIVEPCPILVDQIHLYFVLKPANCYQEIRLHYPYSSKFFYLFIDFLIVQARLKYRSKDRWKIKINFQELAYKLRMGSYIKTRQHKRIRKVLEKCYRAAEKLGYLLKHETLHGVKREVEQLTLNPIKFKKTEKKKKETEEMEKEDEAM